MTIDTTTCGECDKEIECVPTTYKLYESINGYVDNLPVGYCECEAVTIPPFKHEEYPVYRKEYMDNVDINKTIKRFAIVNYNSKLEAYVLSRGNQYASNHFDSYEEAEYWLSTIRTSLSYMCGTDDIKIIEINCYESGHSCFTVFDLKENK